MIIGKEERQRRDKARKQDLTLPKTVGTFAYERKYFMTNKATFKWPTWSSSFSTPIWGSKSLQVRMRLMYSQGTRTNLESANGKNYFAEQHFTFYFLRGTKLAIHRNLPGVTLRRLCPTRSPGRSQSFSDRWHAPCADDLCIKRNISKPSHLDLWQFAQINSTKPVIIQEFACHFKFKLSSTKTFQHFI